MVYLDGDRNFQARNPSVMCFQDLAQVEKIHLCLHHSLFINTDSQSSQSACKVNKLP